MIPLNTVTSRREIRTFNLGRAAEGLLQDVGRGVKGDVGEKVLRICRHLYMDPMESF